MKPPRITATAGGVAILSLVAGAGLLAPVLAPYDPHALVAAPLEMPSAQHALGANDIGQDLLSQIMWGARAALIVAIVGAAVATVVGGLAGSGAGLLGGAVDTVLMRVVDTLVAVPGLPLMVLIASLAGPSRPLTIGLIGLIGSPVVARVVRNQAMSIRHRGFITASRGSGAGRLWVLRHHMLPALGPVLVSRFLIFVPIAIFIHAGLAFVGLGDPLEVSWGTMLNKAINYPGLYFTSMWVWWVLPAGFAIAITVLGFTLIGIGLEPWFNPRLERGR